MASKIEMAGASPPLQTKLPNDISLVVKLSIIR